MPEQRNDFSGSSLLTKDRPAKVDIDTESSVPQTIHARCDSSGNTGSTCLKDARNLGKRERLTHALRFWVDMVVHLRQKKLIQLFH